MTETNIYKDDASLKALFSKDSFDCLKGFLAVVVLFHHLFQHTDIVTNMLLRFFFQNMGIWAVGGYLFISGYGLYYSYLKKGSQYVSHFPKSRILPFYLICCLLVVIYFVFKINLGLHIPLKNLFLSFSFWGTIIENGWYLQTILFLYIAFWGVFRFIGEKLRLPAITIAVIFYTLYMYNVGSLSTSYETAMCFVAGGGALLLNLKYKLQLCPMRKVSFIAFIGALFVGVMCSKMGWRSFRLLFIIVSNVSFCFFIVGIDYFVFIKNALFKKIGDYSLEIYTLQGIWILLFHSKPLYIHNDSLFAMVVFICTFVSAYIFHFFTKKIYEICRK